ncbi:MAG: hypothetical protein WD689_05185 [Gaiellaceae bacterium]
MEEERKRDRLRSFLLGGLVGASAVVATRRRRRAPRRPGPGGLAAFEQAPCYREVVEAELVEDEES